MNANIQQVMNLVGQLGGDEQQAGLDGHRPGQDDAGRQPDLSGAGYGRVRQGVGYEQGGGR